MPFEYSVGSGLNNSDIGRFEHPIRMVIENESDILRAQKGTLDLLFNVEKSNKYGETIQWKDEFDVFRATAEGAGAGNDTMGDTFRKFIEHIAFMKEFTITRQMLDDSNMNEMARAARSFVRSYYLTRNKIAETVLANGKKTSVTFGDAKVDLTTADEKALFATDHKYGGKLHKEGTQSNLFGHNRYASSAHVGLTLSDVEDLLMEGANRIRNMKDENGEVLGYTADTIVIPGNLPLLERYIKQAVGSGLEPHSANNGLNIHYGNWSVVILPTWQATITSNAAEQTYPIIVMSGAANKNLAGNMFFNRVPLSIKNHEDTHTRNWIWNGYCRFGIGFGTYKHIALIESYSASTDGSQTQL